MLSRRSQPSYTEILVLTSNENHGDRHTFSSSPNFFNTTTNSLPIAIPVCRPWQCLKSMRKLFRTHSRGSSGGESIYWMLKDEKCRRRFELHPSETSETSEVIACEGVKAHVTEWVIELTLMISLSISSNFATFSMTAFPIHERLGISFALTFGFK